MTHFRHILLLLISSFLASTAFAQARPLSGRVVDASGNGLPGARVTVREAMPPIWALTDDDGSFTLQQVPGNASILITLEQFEPAVIAHAGESSVRVVLNPSISEEITVTGPAPFPTRSTIGTKTDTPLRDVPQAITVIDKDVIAEQSMEGISEIVRYVPGVGIAQGEGNRDTPVFRGNSSTSDFFVNGIRDDVQYFRDLYNVERVEILKGPNAMMFGRGGVGGVLNRVTRQADWTPAYELNLQAGSWDERRVTADLGQDFSESIAARITGVYEDSDSYRDGVFLERSGVNPTMSFILSPATLLTAGYEYFQDERTADRGIPSFAGRPIATDESTFFGNPDLSLSDAEVNTFTSGLEHRVNDRITFRSRISWADYDKIYQNIYPGAVDSEGLNVSIRAYNNATERENRFGQADLILREKTGRFDHTILVGVEIGRQITDNFRNTGYFTTLGENVTSVDVPVSNPTIDLPVTFRQSATDADNHGVADTVSLYIQDQIVVSPRLQLIGGIRYDSFRVDFLNERTGQTLESDDGMVSPRLGLVFKPSEPVSLYASYSLSYMPRAGEQLSSLNLANSTLDPEEFTNYEVGAKWQAFETLEISAALYRLDRGNVAVADPVNPGTSFLVDGQRTEGLELSATGSMSRSWSILAAYAWQQGEILESLSSSAPEGAGLAQLPEHSFSLWNRYDFSNIWAVGLGVIYRDEIFTSTDNAVTLPSFTRVDAAVFYEFSPRLGFQLNIENLLDTEYYASAHNNVNITPGSPLALSLGVTTHF